MPNKINVHRLTEKASFYKKFWCYANIQFNDNNFEIPNFGNMTGNNSGEQF